MRHRFTSTADGRLDKIIADHTPLSRKRATKTIEAGSVRVNGKRIKFASHHVATGAHVEIGSAAANDPNVIITTRHQDASVLVVDKPYGLPTQATKEGSRTHLYGILCAQHRYVGLHHRLDTPASGLVLFTLDRRANKAIANAFQTHAIERTYQLIVVGDPGVSGTWTVPIAGKPATTHFKRLAMGGGMALIEASLETGRTHQIRVHAAAAGHPIVGDRRHGGAAGKLWNRLALHACSLKLTHPISGTPLTVSSPTPPDLEDLWSRVAPQCSPTTEAEETSRDPQS